MKINFKKKAIIYSVLAALLIVATLFDLQISKAIADLGEGQYRSQNLFGRFLESICAAPAYLMSGFAGAILVQNLYRREKNTANIVLMVVLVILCIAVLTYMSKQVFGYIAEHFAFKHKLGGLMDWIAYIAMGMLLTLVLLWITKGFSSDFLNKALAWCLIVILTAALSQIITQGTKLFIGRARFKTMNAIGDFSLFTNWYQYVPKRTPDEMMQILGITSEGFKSFPSGHATSSAIFFTLLALPQIVEKLNTKKGKIILNVCVFGYIAIAMFGRILMGAHFLSDVVMGCTITFTCYILSTLIINKITSKFLIKPLKAGKLNYRLEEEQI